MLENLQSRGGERNNQVSYKYFMFKLVTFTSCDPKTHTHYTFVRVNTFLLFNVPYFDAERKQKLLLSYHTQHYSDCRLIVDYVFFQDCKITHLH